MIKNIFNAFIVFVMLSGTGAFCVPDSPFAYVSTLLPDKQMGLIKFNTSNDKEENVIAMPDDKWANCYLIDEKGGIYLSEAMQMQLYGREIFYYDPRTDKVEVFGKLDGCFGPAGMVLLKNDLIVEIKGNDDTRGYSGILFFDRRTGEQKASVYLEENNPRYNQANINDIYYDKDKYLLATTFCVIDQTEEEIRKVGRLTGSGAIYVIDVENKKIVSKIDLGNEYKYIYGVCKIEDKIYVAPAAKGRMDDQGYIPRNDEILVYSFKTGLLTNKIKTTKHPAMLVYDKLNNKMFVSHLSDIVDRDEIDVIDLNKEIVTDTIKIPGHRAMSLVAPGKLYVTSLDEHNKTKLYVIDTRTDKITKVLNGSYYGISTNSTL